MKAGECPVCDRKETANPRYLATLSITRRFDSLDEIADFANIECADVKNVIDIENRSFTQY